MWTILLLETNPAREGQSSWVSKKIRTSNRPDLSIKAKGYPVRLRTNYLWLIPISAPVLKADVSCEFAPKQEQQW